MVWCWCWCWCCIDDRNNTFLFDGPFLHSIQIYVSISPCSHPPFSFIHFIHSFILSFMVGVCACSTCHLIFPQQIYDTLPESSEDEEDMLDMAFGLTETSRLGCQVNVTTEMDGMVVQMPAATRNFYVDGHVPKPH